MDRQTKESQELVKKVKDVIAMPQNDDMSLDVASRICNSYLLSQTDQLISFAFHESSTVIEATKEAKELDMLVTTLYLDWGKTNLQKPHTANSHERLRKLLRSSFNKTKW